MADRIEAAPDHVAVAVPDRDEARPFWLGLGGAEFSHFSYDAFAGYQFLYGNGAKVEVVAPPVEAADKSFVTSFLARFGTRVHHLTIRVPDLHAALATLASGGLDPVDVRDDDEHWKEGFLRPSQIGGFVVQVVQTSAEHDRWQERRRRKAMPPAGGAEVLGPRLLHPDLEQAGRVWSLLGADVGGGARSLLCAWEGSPLTLLVDEGSPAGPVSLRMTGTPDIPADPGSNPVIEGDDARP
jgi:catechol 2,3-dioxygenase-like lactoylglutathione lyase family enzyme